MTGPFLYPAYRKWYYWVIYKINHACYTEKDYEQVWLFQIISHQKKEGDKNESSKEV